MLIMLALVLNDTFSDFTNRNEANIANIKVAGMNYSMHINEVLTTSAFIPKNKETILNISLTSLNTSDFKYELIYDICQQADCGVVITKPEDLFVEYSSRTIDEISGVILASGNKNIRIVVINNTDSSYYIKFGINAGYIHNTLTLERQIENEYNEEDVTIAAIIEGEISTTFPTTDNYIATVECLTNKGASNASGTATWDGTKWVVDVTGADSGKTVCNVYFHIPHNEEQGVNKPVLFAGMTPVKWDESFNEIETTEIDPDWYDYNNKKWANAKTADDSYWVWIPRYAYRITSGYHSSKTGTIDIKFLKGETNANVTNVDIKTTGYNPGVKDTSMHHFLHPAFDVEGSELGFWVAKYEPTAAEGVATITGTCDTADNVSTKTVKIIPQATSWRCINISNAYNATLAMKTNPVYGWEESEVDPHMLTNLEWGAVTYLSKSEFGADTLEIWNNSFNQYRTGCSGSGVSAHSEAICVEYNTTNGAKASTTHNIYGVYDMSGGAWDRVSAFVNNGHADLGTYGQSILNAANKYENIYNMGTSDTRALNYEANKNIYGDAVYETSSTGDNSTSWYGDYSSMPLASGPWFNRGGNFSYSTSAGPFHFFGSSSNAAVNASFRPAVRVAS